MTTGRVAVLALVVSLLVELSQLYHAPWIDSVRQTTIGGLILGFGFLWSDLVCYAAGVGLGVALERISRRIASPPMTGAAPIIACGGIARPGRRSTPPPGSGDGLALDGLHVGPERGRDRLLIATQPPMLGPCDPSLLRHGLHVGEGLIGDILVKTTP